MLEVLWAARPRPWFDSADFPFIARSSSVDVGRGNELERLSGSRCCTAPCWHVVGLRTGAIFRRRRIVVYHLSSRVSPQRVPRLRLALFASQAPLSPSCLSQYAVQSSFRKFRRKAGGETERCPVFRQVSLQIELSSVLCSPRLGLFGKLGGYSADTS